jgi:ABC-type lipoprotein export system ATPase subunit
MYIERVQIEEGFLDGLDVNFTSGLNVIIGARGTGKTSLIELIRFCLDVGGNSEITRRSRDHALSILGTGQVTITLNDRGQEIIVSRTSTDVEPRTSGQFKKPMIFSQTEIETIGLESVGRLRLIDSFIGGLQGASANEDKLAAEIRSITSEIDRSRRDIEELDKQLKLKPSLLEELKVNDTARQGVALISAGLGEKTKKLEALTATISQKAAAISEISRVKNDIAIWYQELDKSVKSSVGAKLANEKLLLPYQLRINAIKSQLEQSVFCVAEIYHELESVEKIYTDEKSTVENLSRQMRTEVEGLQTGSGQVMRKAQELSEKLAKLNVISDSYLSKTEYLKATIAKRGDILESLDQSRKERFTKRAEVVAKLNTELSPNIKIHIRRNGQYPIFATALGEALRGSGIKYGEIVPSIAENISPRALLDAIDNFDFEIIAETANISFERASRILSHLRSCDLGTLSTINIEDEIILQLLDGRDYKDLKDLSTGQRCTVILPLVLAHHDRVLVVDQPEDHIDNAFIASTLIKSVLSRTDNSQIIFSTHNPNIPVLGNADTVLHMGSDGRRGYKLCIGALDETPVVSSISTVMEGGAAAFSKRADFYKKSSEK